MSLDLDLGRFRKDAAPESPAPTEITWRGVILAFDQSIASTGWAHLDVRNGEVLVKGVGMLPTPPADKGHESTLARSVDIHKMAVALIDGVNPDLIAHETPPIGGGKMMRPESSLVAATSIRIAAAMYDKPVRMIGAQKGKKCLTGDGGADKKEVRAALDRMFPVLASLKPRNEHTYDAIAVGYVTALEEN